MRNDLRLDVSLAEDVKRLHKEIDALVALSPRTVKFVDRSYILYPKLAHAIWRYIIELDCSCGFHFEIYPNLLTEDDLRLLGKAPRGGFALKSGFNLQTPPTN